MSKAAKQCRDSTLLRNTEVNSEVSLLFFFFSENLKMVASGKEGGKEVWAEFLFSF